MDFVLDTINVPFWEALARRLPRTFLIAVLGYLLVRGIVWAIDKTLAFRGFKLSKGLRGILISVISALFWVIYATVVFASLGLGNLALYVTGSTAILVFFLSAGAAQLVADLISGFFLSGDKNFKVGDLIIAGEDKTEGIIESMDARKTRIRDKNDKLHVIPNSVVEKKEWVVLSTAKELRDRNAK